MVVTKDKFLDAEHPAVIIDVIVERLDLRKIYEVYSLEGNPPYHPKMMLKIIFYAYYISIMSCRLIWDAVINRSDFIYLAAGWVPDFRTINNYWRKPPALPVRLEKAMPFPASIISYSLRKPPWETK